jgi:hypothetical protein
MVSVNTRVAMFTAVSFPAFIASAWVAEAACLELWARSLNPPHSRKSDFRLNEQFVVCVRLAHDAYVSIWDQPPHGDPSRLLPNVLTHKAENARTRAVRLRGEVDHCFGTPDTFPLFFPVDQGQGSGTLSVFATSTVDDQPALEDYESPGERIRRDRMDRIATTYRMDANVCSNKMKEYFDYRITK